MLLLCLLVGKVEFLFVLSGKREKFCGGIFNFLGDHMGQIDVACLPSPLALYGTDRLLFFLSCSHTLDTFYF
jgi:hypothetical protein